MFKRTQDERRILQNRIARPNLLVNNEEGAVAPFEPQIYADQAEYGKVGTIAYDDGNE